MDFKYSFPVVKGIQADRVYYIAMVPMKMLPRLFPGEDEYVPPEYRAQRRLNESRIPVISRYILENRKNYVFSALAASIDGKFEFKEGDVSNEVGVLEVSMDARFLLNDGQHSFQYIRFWDIYSEDMGLNIGKTGGYYFGKTDRIMAFLIENHIHPYIEIGFKPIMLVEQLNQYLISEPKDIVFRTHAQARHFFHAFVSHYANRYGIGEVEQWYFELWKDPRLLDAHDCRRYFAVFEACYDALKEISPNIRIGGGSIHMTFDGSFFADFLFQWKQRIAGPDFLTIYSYPYHTGDAGHAIDRRRSQKSSYLKDSVLAVTDELARIGFSIKEVHVSEWNGSVSNRNRMNDSVYQGAYVMKNIIDNIGLIREHAPCRHGTPSNRMRLCKANVSQVPCRTCPAERLRIFAEPVLVSDRKLLPGFFPCVHHLPGIFRSRRHRLFTHDMLARLKSRNRNRAVGDIRRADMHDIYCRIFQKLMIVRIVSCAFHPILPAGLLRTLFLNIAECSHFAQSALGL